jgi:hypothetical protein
MGHGLRVLLLVRYAQLYMQAYSLLCASAIAVCRQLRASSLALLPAHCVLTHTCRALQALPTASTLCADSYVQSPAGPAYCQHRMYPAPAAVAAISLLELAQTSFSRNCQHCVHMSLHQQKMHSCYAGVPVHPEVEHCSTSDESCTLLGPQPGPDYRCTDGLISWCPGYVHTCPYANTVELYPASELSTASCTQVL